MHPDNNRKEARKLKQSTKAPHASESNQYIAPEVVQGGNTATMWKFSFPKKSM